MAAPIDRTDSTLVIGLGRFGAAVAATLDRLGREVLAVETNPATVRQWTGRIPLVEADATDMEALEQLGATEFGTAVVGVATSIEASVLIAGNLVDLQTPQIWAKAISRAHGRILRRIGAHHVVYPEFDAGQRAAHLVSGRMLDYIEMEKGGFTIVKMRPPMELHGFTIGESKVRSRYGVTVFGLMSPGEPFEYATPDTLVSAEDVLVVGGDATLLERFANRRCGGRLQRRKGPAAGGSSGGSRPVRAERPSLLSPAPGCRSGDVASGRIVRGGPARSDTCESVRARIHYALLPLLRFFTLRCTRRRSAAEGEEAQRTGRCVADDPARPRATRAGPPARR